MDFSLEWGRVKMGNNLHVERDFTKAVAEMLRFTIKPEVKYLYGHFPAGEMRTAKTGRILKEMGTPRGWPDFLFLAPASLGGPAGMELKTETGKLNPFQVIFRDAFIGAGYRWALCRNMGEAIEQLTAWGLIQVS
jgi:hypothetical protein